MENRELIKEYLSKFDGKYNEEDTTYGFWDVQCIMDLARADEREKMQGVGIWVSVDEDGTTKLSEQKLDFVERNIGDYYKYSEEGFCAISPYQFGELLGVGSGQCRKFKIVECGND